MLLLRIAVADALWQRPFPAHALSLAHLFSPLLYLGQHLLHLLFLHASGWIALDDVVQLFEAELHVVEVLDGLAELNGYVGQHGLEVAEGAACSTAALRVNGLLGDGVVDEDHETPVSAVVHDGVELVAALGGDEAQHFSVDVCRPLLCKLLADVGSDGINVAHHHINVGEDVVVDALQHIVRLVLFGSLYFVGVVDETFAQRLYLADGPFVGKTAHDSC